MGECLHAVQAEFAKAEVEHRRDRLGRDALSVVRGIDDVADLHALIADMLALGSNPPSVAHRRYNNERTGYDAAACATLVFV